MRGVALLLALVAVLAAGCGDDPPTGRPDPNGAPVVDEELSGTIVIDGSSTLAPFAQAAAELFNEEQPDVEITVDVSGTSAGLDRFCKGDSDIATASRPIATEVGDCAEEDVEFQRIHVANDGVTVVTNPSLEIDCLTTDQLREVWDEGSSVASLADVDPSLPDAKLSLHGPGRGDGTFDVFTRAVNGERGRSRDDYDASDEDEQIVAGIEEDDGGLGYVGFSAYAQNMDDLDVVAVDGGAGCVEPSTQTVQDGSYTPLSRPLFMYPKLEALGRPEVKAFMEFVVANQQTISLASRLVPLTGRQAAQATEDLSSAETAAG